MLIQIFLKHFVLELPKFKFAFIIEQSLEVLTSYYHFPLLLHLPITSFHCVLFCFSRK